MTRAGPVTTRSTTGEILGTKPAYNPATASRIIAGLTEPQARAAARRKTARTLRRTLHRKAPVGTAPRS